MTTAVEREAVRFEEAIAFLRNKVGVPTNAWTDLWEAMHSVAFVVAGASTEAIVADFHQAVSSAIENGTTLATFRKDFDRIVREHGWQYRGSAGGRSRVIFETNLRMAYSAGRWAQIQRLKHLRPYLRYVTVDDERVRPEHRKWHNVVLPVDHPFWLTHFPPCGWGCRCRVVSLNHRDLGRYGLKVSDQAPEVRYVAREIKTLDGPIYVQTPEGIDPGFGYNPGAGAFGHGFSRLAQEKHGSWRELVAPGKQMQPIGELAANATKTEPGTAGWRGDELVIGDPTGASIRIGLEIVEHILEATGGDESEQYLALLPDLIRDPVEIWIGFVEDLTTGKVSIRRRYLSSFDFLSGGIVALVADADGREWSGVRAAGAQNTLTEKMRKGLRIYHRR